MKYNVGKKIQGKVRKSVKQHLKFCSKLGFVISYHFIKKKSCCTQMKQLKQIISIYFLLR